VESVNRIVRQLRGISYEKDVTLCSLLRLSSASTVTTLIDSGGPMRGENRGVLLRTIVLFFLGSRQPADCC